MNSSLMIDTYEYIVDMLAQLAQLARENGLEDLAREIEAVLLEADRLTQPAKH